MEFFKRILFFIAAACFLVLVLTFTFSLLLIVWPFIVIGILASAGYAWLANYKRAKNGGNASDGTYYHSERFIVIEQEPEEKPKPKKKK